MVGLLIVVFGSISLINLGLKTYVFKDADRYTVYIDQTLPKEQQVSPEEQQRRQDEDIKRNRQRELSQAIASIAVGIPLYAYHWKKIQKEKV